MKRSVALCLTLLFSTLVLSTIVSGCGSSTLSSSAAAPSGPASPSPAGPSPSASPTPATPAPTPTPGSTTLSQLQQQSGWGNCTSSCTSTGTAVYSMTQNVSSPSLSGSSARFELLSGTQPYSGALWFNLVGAFPTATHFVYDLSFYIDNPSAAQALEFGVSQSLNGSRYRFYTQCLLVGGQVWRVWNPATHAWAVSSVPCGIPPANTWTHLIWEFERDSSGNVIFIAVTVNDNRSVVNMTMGHDADPSSGLDVAFQADANVDATPYSVWLDNVTLTFW